MTAIQGPTSPITAGNWELPANASAEMKANLAYLRAPSPSLGKIGTAVLGGMALASGGVLLATRLEDKASTGTGVAGGIAAVGGATMIGKGIMKLGALGGGGKAAAMGVAGAGLLGLGTTLTFQSLLKPIKDDL